MRLIPLAGFDESLRPLSPARLARRDQITALMRSVAKASEQGLPLDERRQVLLVQAEQVERTAAWSRWDWCRWALPWLLLGLGLGALTDLAVRIFVN